MKRAAIFLTLFLPVSLLLGLGYVVNGRVQAKPQLIDVGGTITTDSTWTAANSPYIITDTVTIEAGVTLTIEAGVTVMFEAGLGQHMEVEGHLEVAGTAVNPVIITSIGDQPANRWIGMRVASGSANFTIQLCAMLKRLCLFFRVWAVMLLWKTAPLRKTASFPST